MQCKNGFFYIVLLMVIFFQGVTGKALSAETFNAAVVFSENRQYASNDYPFSSDNPYYNGAALWFMMAAAFTEGNNPFPVAINSTVTGNRALTYYGPWLNARHFSVDGFPPGAFGAPGASWENMDYAFSVGDASSTWNIPSGSIQRISVITGSTTGLEHPMLTWDPVAGADAYDILILPTDNAGFPVFNLPLFKSDVIPEDGSPQYTYTYNGDLFTLGMDLSFWGRAIQYHPLSGSDPRYFQQPLNRSGMIFKHRGHTSQDLSAWTVDKDANTSFNIDPQDNTRCVMTSTATDGAGSQCAVKKTITDAMGIMADVTVQGCNTTPSSTWGGAGLRINPVNTLRGTFISAQIRLEWAGGAQNIHCRVREHKANGDTYQEIARVNQHFNWGIGQTVPLGVALVNNNVVFWAEGRGILTVPLPTDTTPRSDSVRFFTATDPGAMDITAQFENVRVPTLDQPFIFGLVSGMGGAGCDINGDGKIGLEEAIGVLQLISGVHQ